MIESSFCEYSLLTSPASSRLQKFQLFLQRVKYYVYSKETQSAKKGSQGMKASSSEDIYVHSFLRPSDACSMNNNVLEKMTIRTKRLLPTDSCIYCCTGQQFCVCDTTLKFSFHFRTHGTGFSSCVTDFPSERRFRILSRRYPKHIQIATTLYFVLCMH